MKRPSRLDYAYAVGRVRALERTLVSKPVFEDAAEEKTVSASLKVIFETGRYPVEQSKMETSGELDEFIGEEKKALLGMMEGLLLEKEVFMAFCTEAQPGKALSFSENTGYVFIRDYFRHKIDLGNLKVLARVKYSGFPRERLAAAVLKGGFIGERAILEGFGLSAGEMEEKIHATPYHRLWARSMDALEARESFVELERGIEDFLMGYMLRAKQIVFGPEPVFAYGMAKLRELSLFRLVGVGKLTQVKPEILKERISATYV